MLWKWWFERKVTDSIIFVHFNIYFFSFFVFEIWEWYIDVFIRLKNLLYFFDRLDKVVDFWCLNNISFPKCKFSDVLIINLISSIILNLTVLNWFIVYIWVYVEGLVHSFWRMFLFKIYFDFKDIFIYLFQFFFLTWWFRF